MPSFNYKTINYRNFGLSKYETLHGTIFLIADLILQILLKRRVKCEIFQIIWTYRVVIQFFLKNLHQLFLFPQSLLKFPDPLVLFVLLQDVPGLQTEAEYKYQLQILNVSPASPTYCRPWRGSYCCR